jgi:SdrD B-like domain/Domain of unknown function DUF11
VAALVFLFSLLFSTVGALADLSNTATATGTPAQGVLTQPSDTVNIPVQPLVPGLQLLKGVTFNDENGDGFGQVGETLTYTFSVKNTGNATLTNVSISDPSVTVVGGPIASLAPGITDIATFTATYTLLTADIAAGTHQNQAVATGSAPGNVTVTDTSDSTNPADETGGPSDPTTITFGDAPIVATDDTPASVNGGTGNPSVINAFTNDTLNGTPVTVTNITATIVTPASNPGVSLDPATGIVSVAPGVPAGSYTITYKICETLNPTNCDQAIVTVPVGSAVIVADDDSVSGINGLTGAPNVLDVMPGDTLNGNPATLGGTGNVALTVVTPATPIGGGPVPTLDPATGQVSVPANTPAGTYTITYQICENLNPTSCDQGVATVGVIAAPIVAVDDAPASVNGGIGNPSLVNAFTNDMLNGAPVVITNITATIVTPASNPGVALDPATGVVSVAPGTPAGSYTITYQICENLNPTNCDQADVIVTVGAGTIVADDDSVFGVIGMTGGANVLDVIPGDTLNGNPATLGGAGNVTMTVVTPAAPINGGPVPTLNPATGLVTVPPMTPSGLYLITYQICENLNPSNCDQGVATIGVNSAPIVAIDDNPASVNGGVGNPSVINAFTNDALNGVPVTVSTITASIVTPASNPSVSMDPATGVVSVAPGVPAGTYTISYEICETLNPTNCDQADVNVTVGSGTIVADDDSVFNTTGMTGGANVLDVLPGDTLNGNPATLGGAGNVTMSVLTPAAPVNGGPVPTLNPATGLVTVPPMTPSGAYTITYQICEKLNPANCDQAVATIGVNSAPIVAIDDNPASVNGGVGNPSVINAFTNDTLNGVPVTVSTITASIVTPASNPGVAMDPATGVVSVAPATPAGSYTISYEICETLNPTNCDQADVTVTVGAGAIAADDDSVFNIIGMTGGANVLDVLPGDTLNGNPATLGGAGNVTMTILTPATPVAPGAPVPALDPVTGLVTVPPGTPSGPYTITYQICEKLNPANCDQAVATIGVNSAPIVAIDENPAAVNGGVGNPSLVNAFTNDTLNGAPVVIANITATIVTPASNPGVSMDPATGVVSVAPGTPAGSYTITYEICEKLNPTNCDQADVIVTVNPGTIVADDESVLGIIGMTGGANVLDILPGDTLNGNPATLGGTGNVTMTVLTTATPNAPGDPVPTLDPATGLVTVPPMTPSGTYTITYQICENLNPTNCDQAVATIGVTSAPLVADDDVPTPVDSTTGSANVVNAFTNDTLNGNPVSLPDVTVTIQTPASNPGVALDTATGIVSVAPGTPPGVYTITYQLCENLNLTNCDSATVTVRVSAGPVVADDDSASGVNGLTGASNVLDVMPGDTLGGNPATLGAGGNVTATVVTPASPVNGGPVPVLDPATGLVSVPANTPAGTYTITYEICETINPANCDQADATINVFAAPIVANDDAGSGPGTGGAVPGLNVLTNDTLNGQPIVPANVTITPATTGPLTVNADGTVTVAPNTPAGPYTVTYTVCEKLNPTNCDTADVVVTVNAGNIAADADSVSGINGLSGGSNVLDVLPGDTLNGNPALLGGTGNISMSVVTPAAPINGGPVPTLNVATGLVSVPAGTPAGSYVITYEICETLNPTNCAQNTATIGVIAALIVANDDSGSANSASGNPSVVNAFTNDTLNGNLVVASNITATIITPASNPGVALDPATGTVSVAPGTPAGSYTIVYEICENLNATNCDQATVTVTVNPAPIVATDDTGSGDGAVGGTVPGLNVLTNDTLNGVPVVPSQVVVTPVTTGPLTVNADGTVTVAPGTPAGPYTVTYTLCEVINPANCDTADVVININAGNIVADADAVSGINGLTGATGVLDVLPGDTLNGNPATLGGAGNVTMTVVTPATPVGGAPVPVLNPATGLVNVPAGTPAGSYQITYQICENLNPTNCAQAVATIGVIAAPIVAADDTLPAVNGGTGNPGAGNAFTNDTLNGAPVNPGDITATIITPASNTGVTLDPATGVISVVPGTPAGNYTIVYEICENLNSTNCDQATITVPVDPAPILANDDAGSIGGAGGVIPGLDVRTNDTLNGVPVVPSQVTITPVTTGPVTVTANGTVTVAPGTPAGPYTVTYTLCEILNPTNCDTATVTVTVNAGNIAADNDSVNNVNGMAGAPDVLDVLPGDTLDGSPATLGGSGNVTMSVVTPATPVGGAPVPVLDPATGLVSVPAGTPASPYTITYRICENLNPTNCATAVATVNVVAAPIVANDDSGNADGATGGLIPGLNILTNDTLDGVPALPANVTVTPVTTGPLTVNADGTVTVAPGTPAGPYTINYTLCEVLNPANCDPATVTITVNAGNIVADNDSVSGINGLTGATDVLDVLPGDTLNGNPALLGGSGNISMSVVTPATPISGGPVPTLNVATGRVSVPAGTQAGAYNITYQICETLNPLNCTTAVATVNVSPAPIVANDDAAPNVSGIAGNPNAITVFPNDTLNGVAVNPAAITTTIVTPAANAGVILDPATGIVSVAPNTPAGSYTITYRICEKLNPANCDDATVTVPVDAAPIVANDDTTPSVDGATGNPALGNAFTNDTLNGTPVNVATITATIITPASNPNISMNPATGVIAAAPGTPNGTYTIIYQICERLNPANCDQATVTVVVTSGPIVADNDSVFGINGYAGGPDILDVLPGDLLNGAPVTVGTGGTVIVSVVTPATPVNAGNPVPVLNPATGRITVPAGTPAASYPITYQICDALNPGNCATAIATVDVIAAPILAVDDTAGPVNGASGNPSVINAFANDTINGLPVTAAGLTSTIVTPASNPKVALDPATGAVSVASGTPAGAYTISYRICEKINPDNCDEATVTVNVDQAPITAVNDTPPITSSVGGATLPSVLLNDDLNGALPTVGPSGTVTLVETVAEPTGNLTLNPDGTLTVKPDAPNGTYELTYQICEVLNPANCATAVATVVVDSGLGSLAGTVYEDSNSNGSYDRTEPVEGGYTVQLLRNGIVFATTTTNPDGSYLFISVPPGTGYTVAAFSPDGTRVLGQGIITIAPGQNVTDVNLPIDPSGVVYDAVTRQPVAGAILQLTNASGAPLPAICFVTPVQQGQITGASGQYRFDIAAGASPQCPAVRSEYRLAITAPAGYVPGFASSIPAQGGSLNAGTCPVDTVLGGSCQVQTQSSAPASGQPTTFFTSFLIASGDPDIVHNHIPLDPVPAGVTADLVVAKIAASKIVLRGGQAKYTIRLSNPTAAAIGPVNVTDRMPANFGFVPDSARLSGALIAGAADGRTVTFSGVTVPAGANVEITLSLSVPVNAEPGDYVNEARAINPVTGAQIGNTGRATVTIEVEPVFDCSDIIGKVFDDRNRNGIQDAATSPYEPEKGLPGVRLVTVKGEIITTDKNGLYSVPCAMIPDGAIGSNFILKLDTRTLPTGYVVTTDNPRTIRLTKGKVSKLNFGASVTRVVRLDLKDEAFQRGSTELDPKWAAGVDKVIGVLGNEQSVLRLRYLNAGADAALARERTKAVSKLIQERWKRSGGDYKLEIETTVLK